VSRCVHIKLRELKDAELTQLAEGICQAEGINLPTDVGSLVVKEAGGSARQMLSNLAACREVTSRQAAIAVLRTAVESDATIDLCRFLAAGRGSWMKAASIIKQFGEDGTNPESVRLVVCNYFAKVALGGSERDAQVALGVLDAFCVPFTEREGMAPLVLAVGRIMLAGG
jgi:DNA polymerase III gamma/tau subunit